ncbi:MAG: ribosome assembly factor SBDS [Candidatus Lokiarchaeota archaeon]|nr:ribosome assembly factor SBDS [Candidatus Lokiarchaeota archaeon]
MSAIRGDKRVDIGNHVIARLDKKKKRFEILVDPKKAWDFKEGKEVDIRDIVESFTIFENLLRGEKATDADLQYVFETDDVFEISKIILKEGEIQITEEMRQEFTKELRRKIINFISTHSINPQTNLPHPPDRIKRAMLEAKISIRDTKEDISEQAKRIIKELQSIIPIRMESYSLAIRIPAEFTGKAYNVVSKYTSINKDEWQSDGSWVAVVELPAGLQATLNDELNSLTKGKFEIKKLKK